MLRRAEALAPVLRERSQRCEERRTIPDETIRDFIASGLFRLCRPARFGGYELGWDLMCEVGQILARGCGSQAWVQTVFSDHIHLVGGFALQAQRDVWGEDPDALICASFVPTGRARPVEGGVVFSGRHGFASGIDHAQWALCGGAVYGDGKPQERCLYLVPKRELSVIDDWHVIGLSGTGSKSFEVKEAFVPSHRILSYQQMEDGAGPGADEGATPLYKMPHGGIAASAFAAVAVGIAEGFLGEYLRYTGARVSRNARVAELAGIQISTAAAEAEIEAAGMTYLAPVSQALDMVYRGEPVPKGHRLRTKRNAAFACRLTLHAVERLFNAAGSRAIFESGALQRYFRDLHAAAAHAAVVWDVSMADYGRHLLGVD